MNFKISQKTTKLASSYDLAPDELVFADLVASGWDTKDAFFVAFNENISWNDLTISKTIRVLLAKQSVKKRIRELKKGDLNDAAVDAIKGTEKTEDKSLLEEVSKEQMLRDLVKARRNLKSGTREWNEMNKMIVEITRMKHEELKTEDNTVHYFLPLTCRKCSLYVNSKKTDT